MTTSTSSAAGIGLPEPLTDIANDLIARAGDLRLLGEITYCKVAELSAKAGTHEHAMLAHATVLIRIMEESAARLEARAAEMHAAVSAVRS
ncbi:hypothetical protein ACFPOB_15840 [Bosea eneae]|uniref:ANTAR domain-containing protein n=1 Tax=Bosea eneae TaxID=151454 RepID=A0ABW0ISH9_9HYPH